MNYITVVTELFFNLYFLDVYEYVEDRGRALEATK